MIDDINSNTLSLRLLVMQGGISRTGLQIAATVYLALKLCCNCLLDGINFI